jgi:ribonuclease HI
MDSKLQEIVINECSKYLSTKMVNSIINNINSNYNEIKSNKMSLDVVSLDDLISNELKNENNISIDTISLDDLISNELKSENKDDISIDNKTNNSEYDMIFYTDGACNGNGKAHAYAGFSIYIEKYINNSKYKINKKISNEMFSYNEKTKSKEEPDKYIKYICSNIRAEGYAILYSLLLIKYELIDKVDIINNLNSYLLDENNIYPLKEYTNINNNINNDKIKNSQKYNIIINTDSEFWINVITKWVNSWVKKGTLFDKKNIDLVVYIYYNYNILKNNNINIIFNHVKGHPESKKKDIKTFTKDEMGIFIADKYAVLSKDNHNNNFNLFQ